MCDFQAAHYALNRYEIFHLLGCCAACTEIGVSQAQDRIISGAGQFPPYEDETFLIESWQSLFLGHGLTSETYSPPIELTPPEVMKRGFRNILAHVKRMVEEQTFHDSSLEIFCS
jgi:hypothetical protein